MDPVVHPAAGTGLPPGAARLLGRRTGLVRRILEYLPDRSDPAAYYATGIEAAVGRLSGVEAGSLAAGGTGLRRRASLLRTLGEAAERYCLYFPDHTALVEATHAAVSRRHEVVDARYLSPYEPPESGFDLERIGPATATRWQPTVDLLTGRTVFVPAQWVWMGLVDGDHPRVAPTTSNGTACAPTLEAALAGAIAEYVERDAVMRTWLTGTPPRSVSVAGVPSIDSIVAERFDPAALEVRFVEMASPTGLAVVACAAVDGRDRAPKFTIGGASVPDRDAAYLGALLEVAQTWTYLKDLTVQGGAEPIDPSAIFDLETNLRLYARPERYPDVRWLAAGDGDAGEPSIPARPGLEPPDALGTYLDRFEAAGLTPLAVEVTTRDVGQVGWRVARVVVPELLDLSLPSLPPVYHPSVADAPLERRPHPYP